MCRLLKNEVHTVKIKNCVRTAGKLQFLTSFFFHFLRDIPHEKQKMVRRGLVQSLNTSMLCKRPFQSWWRSRGLKA